MLTIGLTGGIASGKSAASHYLSQQGALIVDTDVISRELVQPGMPALRQIESSFGKQFIQQDGKLDRRRLREHIFNNPSARKTLENILHPAIQTEISQRLSNHHQEPYAVVVIPLLAEKQLQSTVDRVLLIDTSPEIQMQRLCQRDDITRQQAEKILLAQASPSTRRNIADDIIDNSNNLNDFYAALEQVHQKYLVLAKR